MLEAQVGRAKSKACACDIIFLNSKHQQKSKRWKERNNSTNYSQLCFLFGHSSYLVALPPCQQLLSPGIQFPSSSLPLCLDHSFQLFQVPDRIIIPFLLPNQVHTSANSPLNYLQKKPSICLLLLGLSLIQTSHYILIIILCTRDVVAWNKVKGLA